MSRNLSKIRKLNWVEVVEIWRLVEEDLEHWQRTWKAKGFKSWLDWRTETFKNLNGPELSWALFKVKIPLKEVINWRGGMFHSWAKWFYPLFPEQPPRLKNLIVHPGVNNHWYIKKILENFPKATTVSAIRNSAGDIIVVEGMHRCCALALAHHDRITIKTNLTLALADWPFKNLPLLGTGWKKK